VGSVESFTTLKYASAGSIFYLESLSHPANSQENNMLRNSLLIIAALIALILIYAATRPDAFRIERSTRIKAPPEKIFALINDLHQWEAWSPWEKIDPQIKRTYAGAASGKGAVYEWNGNKDIGQGRMEIVEADVPGKLVIKLDFLKPFEAHNFAEFTLIPQGDSTTVTHAMFGPSPYVSKLMGLVFSMDKMVGDKFAEGLGNLKALAEK
jgi:uncharacterized protein YndB with AHSA1/START domain